MSIFQNTCKPVGFGGKLMVHSMNMGHAAMASWGFSHIPVPEKGHCLDIGCGGGKNLQNLLEKCPRGTVTGVDYSEVSVEASRKKNRKAIEAGRCQVLQANVLELPFEAESCDLCTAFETVYFWPDILRSFQEVCRVTKPGGVFAIVNEDNGETGNSQKWAEKIDGMSVYTEAQLRKLLHQAGFLDVQAFQNEKSWMALIARK